jgi:hypothetical protein
MNSRSELIIIQVLGLGLHGLLGLWHGLEDMNRMGSWNLNSNLKNTGRCLILERVHFYEIWERRQCGSFLLWDFVDVVLYQGQVVELTEFLFKLLYGQVDFPVFADISVNVINDV